jgi:hypothetical protein
VVVLSRQNFFILTSRPLGVEESLNADLEIYPLACRGVSTSSHLTALASQVAWITGESQISPYHYNNNGTENNVFLQVTFYLYIECPLLSVLRRNNSKY